MNEFLQSAFVRPVQEFLEKTGDFIPDLLAMIAIVALGLLVAWLVRVIASRLLNVTGFNEMGARLGFSQALAKGGVTDTPSGLISRIGYWVVLLAFVTRGLLTPLDPTIELRHLAQSRDESIG